MRRASQLRSRCSVLRALEHAAAVATAGLLGALAVLGVAALNAPGMSWSAVLRKCCLYYVRLACTPALLASLRILLLHGRLPPRLRALLACPSPPRVLASEAGSGRGFLGDDGRWRGRVSAWTAWRLERAIALDDRLQVRDGIIMEDYSIMHRQDVRLLLARDTDDDAASAVRLAEAVADVVPIEAGSPRYAVLVAVLERLRRLSLAKARLLDRRATPCRSAEHEAVLRRLWQTLKPDEALEDLNTAQWKDLGFQGKSPETDFRSAGVLGLDCLAAFADSDAEAARRVLAESVDAGPLTWYPLAIGSIAITNDVAVEALRHGQLDLLLLDHADSVEAVCRAFEAVAVALLRLFHRRWLEANRTRNPHAVPAVKDFERSLRAFRAGVGPWLERGSVATWLRGRGYAAEDVEVAP